MRSILMAMLLVFASCAEPVPVAPVPQNAATTPSTSTTLAFPVDVAYRCGPVSLGNDPNGWSDLTAFEGDIEAMIQPEARAEFDAARDWWEAREWRIVAETDTTLTLLGYDETSTRYGDVSFELIGDEWRATGWGDCFVEPAVEGFGLANFELDPANPPDPASREIAVLATERACANGRAPDDRDVKATVTETGTQVQILILVEPLEGDATCPSNPAFPFTVSLVGPLGDRRIFDQSTSPPAEKEWPAASRDSEVHVWLAGDVPSEGTAHVFGWSGPDAGALVVSPSNWSREPTWYQTFSADEITITGFVTSCTGCEEECEAEACEQLVRLGPDCSTDYRAVPGFDTTVTIRYTGSSCTIDVDINKLVG